MDYSRVNLHILRMRAREIGVKSLYSYKKADLIEKIKEIERGEVKPYFPKVGRPLSEKIPYKFEEIKKAKNSHEKRVLLSYIKRVREFLDDLEKEIENEF